MITDVCHRRDHSTGLSLADPDAHEQDSSTPGNRLSISYTQAMGKEKLNNHTHTLYTGCDICSDVSVNTLDM